MANDIPTSQNAAPQIRLLRAQRRAYTVARRVAIVQATLTVVVPVMAVLAVFQWPELKALAAALSLVITVLDVTVLDRFQRRLRKIAAKVQEEFDTVVLQLPWNEFTVGRHVDPETVHELSGEFGEDEGELIDWYPPVVSALPIHLARVICQRVNLVYDGKLRARYGAWALAVSLILTLSLVLVGVVLKLSMDDLVLRVLAPAVPIIVWGIREHFRQADAGEASTQLKEQAEGLWRRAIAGECDERACTAESRLFQNAIYQRRTSAPVIVKWVYRLMRPKMESQVSAGADELVRAAQATCP